jgi:prepilin-type N-terminal cleavage/methylation domain-containing protein
MKLNGIRIDYGFTLIELLVVISIIGLLSSIVLASLSTARDKAQYTAGINFDKSHYNTYGVDALAYWSMDAIASGFVRDQSISPSGYNDLTVVGVPSTSTGVFGNSILFPTASDYLTIPSVSSNSSLGNITTTGGTITLWFKASQLSSQMFFGTVGTPTNRVYIGINSSGRAYVARGDPQTILVSNPVKIGDWNNIALSFTGGASGTTQTMKVYFNGKKTGETTFVNGGNISGNSLRIGQDTSGSNSVLGGNIDEIRIYNVILADSEIRDKYFAELENTISKKIAFDHTK